MSSYSTAFTTIIANDLAAGAAFYTAMEWFWRAICSGSTTTSIEFVAQIPSSIPNENGLRLVISLEVDDPSEPSVFDYTSASFRFEEDYVPNLNAPNSTVVRSIALPPPEDSTAAGFTTFAAVLAYAATITDLFGHP